MTKDEQILMLKRAYLWMVMEITGCKANCPIEIAKFVESNVGIMVEGTDFADVVGAVAVYYNNPL
jgi:hypothetical protein